MATVALALGAQSSLANPDAPARASGASFVFGMVPYAPVQQLTRLYEPLVGQFEKSLARPVRLASAPDFEQFLALARAGDYDLVGASPHVARILQREEGFLPLVRATAPLEPVFVMPVDRPLRGLADLKGQSLLVADPFAVHVLMALRELRDQGLVPGRDVKLIIAGTQRNAVQRLLRHDAPAAVGSASTLGLLPADLSLKFKVLAKTAPGLTPMAYLVHPRLRNEAARLAQEVLAFSRTESGQSLTKAAQHDGYAPLSVEQLATVDPLVTEFYRQRSGN